MPFSSSGIQPEYIVEDVKEVAIPIKDLALF